MHGHTYIKPTYGLDFFFVMCKCINACASVQADTPNI